ncbi:MAG: VWA domain-containing protein [Candidatus Bipolaricaulota bacterium]|nr:VWA domain-containing protein [Candidatus Bipolaricaulota bacterium]
MSFALPAAFALLATVLLVVLFALLRSRQRRRDVATFFVWRELHDSLSARTQRLRALLDPLLLLQVATVVAAVFALAQPLVTSRHSGFANLAIVIDASASMSTRMDSGLTRYEAAVRRADEILASYPPSSVSVVLFSKTPRALVAGDTNLAAARKSLAASGPGWEGDGRVSDLVRGLESVGGPSAFEQIIFLSDHPLEGVPFPIRLETFAEGESVGITAFSLRENPDGTGVSAFAELYNGTSESQALQVEITDEKSRTTVETFLEPGERSSYVVPFPTSRGSRFTASIAARDAFPGDDVRYASLRRDAALRVRWLGKDNRYLSAALNAVAPVTHVDATPADLTVAYDVDLDALPEGNVLLVHSSVRDVITLSDRTTSGVVAAAAEDALLSGVEAADIYVESLPLVDVLLPSRPLLTVGGSPFLVRILDPNRLVLVLPSDLTATNLPITVDFPILIRNVASAVMPEQPTTASRWTLVGSPVTLRIGAVPDAVSDPQGQALTLLSDQRAFFPDRPGQYTVRSGADVETVSVNIDPNETAAPGSAGSSASASELPLPSLSSQLRDRQSAWWPILAGAFFALLVAEFLFHQARQRQGGSAG